LGIKIKLGMLGARIKKNRKYKEQSKISKFIFGVNLKIRKV